MGSEIIIVAVVGLLAIGGLVGLAFLILLLNSEYLERRALL